ncbi:MAG: hypothetical protein AB4426_29735 [Xenococcaceae cyanobacterium]
MKDAEARIIKAFLAALSQERSPLSEEVREKLVGIAQSLETRVMDLHALALSIPTLATSYKDARLLLIATAAERDKTGRILPDIEDEDESEGEIINIMRDTRSEVKQLKRILETIDSKFDRAPQVLSSSDPVQAAREEFN